MAVEPTAKTSAWALFDRIVADAAPGGVHSNPWVAETDATVRYEPDFTTLVRLLGVPLHLGAKSRTGVPALALDVWLSYELRRAGFDPDAAWPRPTQPRILPMPISNLLRELPRKDREALIQRRWLRECELAWVVCEDAAVAHRLESALRTEWLPPLNRM